MSEYERATAICNALDIANPYTRVCTKADARIAAEHALRGNVPESLLYMNAPAWVEGTHPLSPVAITDNIADRIESWGKKRDAGCEVAPQIVGAAKLVADIHQAIIDGITMLEEARDLVFPDGQYWKMNAEIVRTHGAQGLTVKKDHWDWNRAKEWLDYTILTSHEKEERWSDIVEIVNVS